jgi:hypothetical protein
MAEKKAVKPAKKEVATKAVITLPRKERGDDDFITASVNGKVYRIKRGVAVEVPIEVAEVVANAEINEQKADQYIDAHLQ